MYRHKNLWQKHYFEHRFTIRKDEIFIRGYHTQFVKFARKNVSAYLLLGASFVDVNFYVAMAEMGETDWENWPGCRPAEVRSPGGQLRSPLIKRTYRLGLSLAAFQLCSERVLESLAKPQPRVLMTRLNTCGPQTPSFWWLYLQAASVCGLPVIAFCLKKETILRKKPITQPLWLNLSLSLQSPGLQWAGAGATPLRAGARPAWAHPLPFVVSTCVFCFPAVVRPRSTERSLQALGSPALPCRTLSFKCLRPIRSRLDLRCPRQEVNSQGLCLTKCSHWAGQSVYPMLAGSRLLRKSKWWSWKGH